MKKLECVVLAGVAGAALLAGCAAGRDAPAPGAKGMSGPATVTTSPCTGPETQVTLNQIAIPVPPSSAASVGVNPGSATVHANGGGVHWKLSGGTYAFTSDGITFKAGAPAGPASSAASANGSDYWWCFNGTTPPLTWPYTIKFYDTTAPAPAKVWSCDPVIVNFDALTTTTAATTVSCS
jgi:hypothetical protein